MNQQKQIQQFENKIKEIKSTLTNWTKDIETYHNQLQTITQQLTEIKLKIQKKIK